MSPVSRDDAPILQTKTLRPREVRVTHEEEVELGWTRSSARSSSCEDDLENAAGRGHGAVTPSLGNLHQKFHLVKKERALVFKDVRPTVI